MIKDANIRQKADHCKQTVWFDEVDSTNSRLIADKDAMASGTIYSALHQSAGRGQRGNRWEAEAGENLMFSLLFKPENLPAERQFVICQAAALSVSGYLGSIGIDSAIKWPNDIYVGDRKICGMLIENSIADGKISTSVIGIGLNLNQTDFPQHLGNATSAAILTGRRFDIRKELGRLTDLLLGNLILTESADGIRSIADAYLGKLYRKGEWHEYTDRSACDPLIATTEDAGGIRFTGRIKGVADNGCLIVEEKTKGEDRAFAFKEISYII